MKHFIIASLFSILNINAIFAFDSIVSLLDFEKEPSIDYYIKIFKENDFYVSNDTMWIGGTPKYERGFYIHPDGGSEFNVTLYHTPSSRQFYKAYIKVTADKKPFVSELLKLYTDIINKYGLPDSAYFRPDDSGYISSDKNESFPVNLLGGNDTTKVRLFFEQSRPFEIVWTKKRFQVYLEVREKYNIRYFSDFFCSIIDKEAEKVYFKELEIIKEEKSAKERKENMKIAFLLIIFAVIAFFVAKKGYKNIKKEEAEKKAKQKAEDERRAKKQEEIDKRHEEYKKQLIDKFGPITRTISNNLYNLDFIKHYDDIYDENRKDVPPTQVTRTNTGSMLGRAAVGGLTLGLAGAVVGAMTAKTESTSNDDTSYISSYVVKIGIKSIEKPTMILKYGSDKSKAEEVYALMQAIIAMK